MDKYICVHGHFYQPPRENPWLEDVELQDSAYPYHDWNERITEECYRQNAASRILGSDKKIIDIVNNYASMSFNFGPTLLNWLQSHAPNVYDKILEADKKSRERFSGHGGAIAQAYNHMILPLSNDRDKHTQVLWGIRDFQKHFERDPEGMWLPETAVNIPTLEVLAEHGIRFTILSPRQARRVRPIGGQRWKNVNENNLDTTLPYLCNLPSGKQIVLFFYHGSIAHDIAYGGLLQSGENLATKLLDSFPKNTEPARLIHIATDGESFGHHHRFGDMALAYCLHHLEADHLATITVYAEYLEKFPPSNEVEIWDNSSWSCVHGIERWKSNCGCCANPSLRGQQQWRAPLREALDWLRDRLSEIYEQKMSEYSDDPWQVRNEYISVINDRYPENVSKFISETTNKPLDDENRTTFLKLLEMQRNAMLMYTSCGWFFDSVLGIETVQIMKYAARAIQLCRDVHNADLEPDFENRLERVPTNNHELVNGKDVYQAYVEPARVNLDRVAAHRALCSVFDEENQEQDQIYCYRVKREDYQRSDAGVQVLITQKLNITSRITLEQQSFVSSVLYLGDQNLFAAIRPHLPDENFNQVEQKLKEAFESGDNNEVIRLMNTAFDQKSYSLSHLFKDQQREIVNRLLENTWEDIEASFRHIYDHNFTLMLTIRNMHMPLPRALATPAEFILNEDLCRDVEAEKIDLNRLKNLAEDVQRLSLDLDKDRLRFVFGRRISRLMDRFEESQDDLDLLQTIGKTLEILKIIVTDIDLQNAQNIFFSVTKSKYSKVEEKAQSGDKTAAQWVADFKNLAQQLGLAVP
jgi:alpha-amylase/alpha-mannosidase (GH57 family)